MAAPIDPRELAARKDFASGRYAQSAETFVELFAETADPVFLRNIARCYQKMKKPDQAIANFEEYLARGNVSPQEHTEIESYIREMEDLKRQPGVAISAPPASTPVATTTGPTLEATARPSVANGATTRPAPSEEGLDADGASAARTARSWRIAGASSALAGALLVGTGVAFGLAAQSAASDVSERWSPGRDSDGRRDRTLQWVAYGAGAAALIAGAGLWFHESKPEARSTSKLRLEAAVWPPALGVEAYLW